MSALGPDAVFGQRPRSPSPLYTVSQRDRVDYNLIDIPRDFAVEAKSPFDKDYMRALYRIGYELGRGGVPWKKVPPGFAD